MRVLFVDNAEEGLRTGLQLLLTEGIKQSSRNGEVIRAVGPVTTVYRKPLQRVVFNEIRDANPFFHLYESLWMLNGRNDVKVLGKYAKNMLNYSDDGVTLHDAYGYRWRKWFQMDQLNVIIDILKKKPEDRQAVLQMWDSTRDLNRGGKAVPCNMIATFQISPTDNRVNMTVFCRSNDIIWGTYGANAVHFGFLLEYVAMKIGFDPGTYTQISVNYHAYTDVFEKNRRIVQESYFDIPPYIKNYPKVIPMSQNADLIIEEVLNLADNDLYTEEKLKECYFDSEGWAAMAHRMMWAHQCYRAGNPTQALQILNDGPNCDWILAGKLWMIRRLMKSASAASQSPSTSTDV